MEMRKNNVLVVDSRHRRWKRKSRTIGLLLVVPLYYLQGLLLQDAISSCQAFIRPTTTTLSSSTGVNTPSPPRRHHGPGRLPSFLHSSTWHEQSSIQVEQICWKTGKVLGSFPSAGTASRETKTHHSSISRVLSGKRKQAGGYFWRRTGSDELPQQFARSYNDDINSITTTTTTKDSLGRDVKGFTVERVDIETGEILNSYPTIRAATKAMGKSSEYLHNLWKSQDPIYGGFLWRLKEKDLKPIEQVELKTGKVLQQYQSVSEATKQTGFKSICRVLQGTYKSSGGYFWREIGSNATAPDGARPHQYKTPVEKVCVASGQVLGEDYESIAAASRSIGVSFTKIPSVAGGFFWRYKGTNVSPPPTALNRTPKKQMRRNDHRTTTMIPVEQIDLQNGNVINTFQSIVEASSGTGVSASGIRHVLRGEYASSGSFFWRWKGSNALPSTTP